MIRLDRYPWPPSENHLFRDRMVKINGRLVTRGRCKSGAYKAYEREVQRWLNARFGIIMQARDFLLKALAGRPTAMIRIDSLYCLPYEMLWTKPPRPRLKRLDAANRLKAQFDTLSKALAIDDHFFYPGPTRKALLEPEDGDEPCVTMKLTVTHILTRSEHLKLLSASW